MINEKWVPISLFIYLLNYSKNIGYYLSKKKSNYFEYNIYIYTLIILGRLLSIKLSLFIFILSLNSCFYSADLGRETIIKCNACQTRASFVTFTFYF